ncbi:hypothetical protein MRY82_02935 [bacterium]|nr:hypothetical protein [bacterium]
MDQQKISGHAWDLLQQAVLLSFSNPGQSFAFAKKNILGSRQLHSSERRHLSNLFFDCIRWRRKLWGDIAPSQMNWTLIEKKLNETKVMKESFDYVYWSKQALDKVAIEVSFPTWLLQLWVSQFGFEPSIDLALAMNEPAKAVFRVNTLKTDRDSVLEFLKAENIAAKAGAYSPWAIELEQRTNIKHHRAYKNGWLEPQDEASQLCILKMDLPKHAKVLDACARTGGKSFAMSALLENSGEILATDCDSRVLEKLSQRAKRLGVKNVQTQWVGQDDPKPIVGQKVFDQVLVDSPCSGLGTLRRNPIAKWTMTPTWVESFPKLQKTILSRYSQYVKDGGSLFYVTCSLNKNENEKVCNDFLLKHHHFITQGEPVYFRPDTDGTDGFFMQKFVKAVKD